MATSTPNRAAKTPRLSVWPCGQTDGYDSVGSVFLRDRHGPRAARPLSRGLPAQLARTLLTEYTLSGDLVLEVAPRHDPAAPSALAQVADLGVRYIPL